MNVCSNNFMGWLQFNSLYFQYKFMKDIIGKRVLMKYIQSELPLSSCWCIWCSFYMLSLFMWWFCFITFYVPIKRWTFAMALLNILIDQLGAGVTLLHQFYVVQYKLPLSGFWFTQHESIDTLHPFPPSAWICGVTGCHIHYPRD